MNIDFNGEITLTSNENSHSSITTKYIPIERTGIHSFFYKNILERFWGKIKNFCKITFLPKVLKWQIVCYIGKIKKFSSENS